MGLDAIINRMKRNAVEKYDRLIESEKHRWEIAKTESYKILNQHNSLEAMGAIADEGCVTAIARGGNVHQVLKSAALGTLIDEIEHELANDQPVTQNEDKAQLTKTQVDYLVKAGASTPFLTVVTTPIETITSVDRSLAHEHVAGFFEKHAIGSETPQVPVSGSFLCMLWEGKLFQAYKAADGNNKKLLLDVFGTPAIRADGLVNTEDATIVRNEFAAPPPATHPKLQR